MTTVIVQDQNNVTVEVTPQPPINVIIDRGVSGPPGPPGDGDVNGPASSIANNVATFSDTTGKLIQDSGKAIPSGEIVGTTDTQPLTNKTISYDSNTMTGVQPTLVSGTSIKTVNSTSLLGSGNVSVGDIVGPASSTNNNIAVFDGATGKLLKDGGTPISSLATVASLSSYLTTSAAASTYQPLDGDLTSIAGLAGTSGLLTKTAANTWSLDTTAYAPASTAVTLTGTQTLTNKTISYASNTLTGVQPTLVSGTSIKTINGNSLLGSGDLVISAGTGDVTGPASSVSGNVATFNGITGKVIQDGGKALPTGAIVGTTDSQALSGKTYNGLTLTAAAAGFTVAGGTTSKTLTVNNTLGLAGTDGSTLDIGSGGTLGSAAYTATTAYAPATSGTAILKGNGSGGTVSAVAGTDYLAPPTGTAILKANAGGALANAVAGTDYQAAITASGLLKGAGGGSVSAAAAGTDYLAPPTGTALLKANSGGALANAVAGTDYLAPPTGTSILKANSGGALANAVAGADYVAPGGALGTPSSGTLSSCTVDGTNEVGYKNIPQNSQSAAYTLVIGDAGKHILHPSADTTARVFTIPANSSVAYPIGTAITFVNQNGAGTITISITTDTMRLAGAGTTGSRTLAANGVATAIKITSTEWIISGTGLT